MFDASIPMDNHELSFVIPTYRLRDVSETIEAYDRHFWKNGHAVRLIVFDDSSAANHAKYVSLLEQEGEPRPVGEPSFCLALAVDQERRRVESGLTTVGCALCRRGGQRPGRVPHRAVAVAGEAVEDSVWWSARTAA